MKDNIFQMSIETVIQELILSKNTNNLTVFMGAGVSCFVNPEYPTWTGVTNRLKQDLPDCTSNDNLDVAQEYLDTYGKEKLYKTIGELLPETIPNQDFYKELLKCRPKYLITTNWDNMLQNYITDGLHMYDIISDDVELMNSKLPNKYIKMHGDLQHDIVLTRESYNSYSKHYPIIENFVKSVLCTSTIVFLGYSFSDEDFMQILSWIKASAPAMPNFYYAFAHEYYDKEKATIFNRKGIKTFVVSNYIELFKILNENEIELFSNKPIHVFANMIKPLCEDNVVLLSSLQKFVSNCFFKYFDNFQIYLQLCTIELTYDYKKSIRNFFYFLFRTLSEENCNTLSNQEDFNVISEILNKSGVIGINYKDYFWNIENTLVINREYLNFNNNILDTDSNETIIRKNFHDLSSDDIDSVDAILVSNTEIIKMDIRNKKYRKLFISYFNQNRIIEFHNKLIISDRIENIDLEQKYLLLPTDIQNNILDIYKFLTEDTLRNTYIRLHDKIKSVKNTLRNSKMAVDNERYRWEIEHRNLNDFVFYNNILIEDSYLFRQVQQKYVELALLRKKAQNSIIIFNKNEIFSCIRYFDLPTNHYNLLKLIADNQVELSYIEDDEEWLFEYVLPYCIKYYKNSVLYNAKPYLVNLLTLFSFSNLSDNNVKKLVTNIHEILCECICSGYILKLIRDIILHLNKTKEKTLSDIEFLPTFVAVIRKYIEFHAGPEEQLEFAVNRFSCYELLYKMAIKNGEVFDDINFLQEVLQACKTATFDTRIQFYIYILMPFYQLGSKNVISYLKDILLNFENGFPKEPVKSRFGEMELIHLSTLTIYNFWYKLKLIELGLKYPDDNFIKELKIWIESINDKSYESLYNNIFEEIYILNKKSKRFSKIYKICKYICKRYNSNTFLQI